MGVIGIEKRVNKEDFIKKLQEWIFLPIVSPITEISPKIPSVFAVFVKMQLGLLLFETKR